MKRKNLWVLFFIICLYSCKKTEPSAETKELIKQNESFWKNRKNTQNKTMQEKIFPIPDTNAETPENRTNRIYINSMQCQYEVFVNDVLLMKLMGPITETGGGMTGDYDINQLMLTSGTHEVKVRIYPKHGVEVFPKGEGQIKLTFSHFRDRNLKTVTYNQELNGHNGIQISQSDKQWISKYSEEHQEEYDGDYQPKTPNKFEGLPVYEWRSTFDAAVPFDFAGWRESVDIKKEYDNNEEVLIKELKKLYQDIHTIFQKKDTDAYLKMVKEREELITSCLLYKQNEKSLREKEFITLIESNEYELEPLFEETFQLEFQAYGKLVMFLHKADGEGIIRLKNKKDPNDTIFLDFRFHRKDKGEPLSII